MKHRLRSALLCMGLTVLACGGSLAAAGGVDPSIEPALNESIVWVPGTSVEAPMLEATLFLPDGPGPHPLAVLNHGLRGGPTRTQQRWRPEDLVRRWLQRGYAAYLPMRAGYADSAGPDDNLPCPPIAERARDGAAQVRRAIAVLEGRRDIDLTRIVVLGHSDGAIATLGHAAEPYPGTRLTINLAGGLRSGLPWCAWQDSLADGLRAVAAAAGEMPTLWLYANNDSFFDPALARRLMGAWGDGGGRGRLMLLPALGDDGHEQILRDPAQPLIWQLIDEQLAALGLPTAIVRPRFAQTGEPAPRASGYARVDRLDRVPYLKEGQRDSYRAFLRQPKPRAVAISEDGAIGWASDLYRTQAAALRWCNRTAAPGRPCRLYAVDDTVVWTPPEPSAP